MTQQAPGSVSRAARCPRGAGSLPMPRMPLRGASPTPPPAPPRLHRGARAPAALVRPPLDRLTPRGLPVLPTAGPRPARPAASCEVARHLEPPRDGARACLLRPTTEQPRAGALLRRPPPAELPPAPSAKVWSLVRSSFSSPPSLRVSPSPPSLSLLESTLSPSLSESLESLRVSESLESLESLRVSTSLCESLRVSLSSHRAARAPRRPRTAALEGSGGKHVAAGEQAALCVRKGGGPGLEAAVLGGRRAREATLSGCRVVNPLIGARARAAGGSGSEALLRAEGRTGLGAAAACARAGRRGAAGRAVARGRGSRQQGLAAEEGRARC